MIASALAIRLARAFRLTDKPGVRKVHSSATPRIGGLAIVAGMMSLTLPALALNNVIGESFREVQAQVIAILCGATFVCLVGLVDDARGIRARTKLLGQVLAALAVCACGVLFESIGLPGGGTFEFGWLSWPITVLWIVGITNALNLIDGLDGLAAGIAAITCAVMAMFSIATGAVIMAVLMLALLGSLLGFLVYNFNPARIFMGDCGSLFLGFILASSSVLSATKTATVTALAITLVTLGVPVFDMFFSMTRRFLQRRSLFAADRGHIHHRLLDMGIPHRQAVMVLYVVTLVAGGFGLIMIGAGDAGAIAIFVVVTALLITVFRLVGAVRLGESLATLQKNMAIARNCGEEKRFLEDAQLHAQYAETFDEWWSAVCRAARDLHFSSLVLRLEDRDGTQRTLMWRHADIEGGTQQLLTLTVPVRHRRRGAPLSLEAQITLQDSLESAGRRTALFSRLISEHSVSEIPSPRSPDRWRGSDRRGRIDAASTRDGSGDGKNETRPQTVPGT